jgi:GxxExxY protein
MKDKLLHSSITEKIIQAFFIVNKSLPNGIPTDVYRKALAIEFEQNNLILIKDYSIEIEYRNIKIGELKADFLINDKVLVKVISIELINKQIEEDAKLLLRFSKFEVCIILNKFGDNEFKRVIFTNDYKK